MIDKIRLINFRNYVDSSFELAPLTLIVGPNGKGKTNIIEAIYYLACGRSFRTAHDGEVIRFGQPFARILSDPLDLTFVDGARVQKKVMIHQKSGRLIDLLGVRPAVLFTPESIALIDGSPALRRQFVDILLSQTSQMYAKSLIEYQRALKQRNGLLHQIKLGDSVADNLGMWDELLVQTALPVIAARKQMTNLMATNLEMYYRRVSSKDTDTFEPHYISSVEKHGAEIENEIELTNRFHQRLLDRRPAELKLARTLVGPHRDDIELVLNNKPISLYGSRGEMRTAVVALKLFEYDYIKEQGDKEPTLLFDDVFSEFDEVRRKTIFEVAPGAQMIFSATDLDHVGKVPKGAEVVRL
jgi:DNA replication and repair protein RecF